jgi:hypothetical protein
MRGPVFFKPRMKQGPQKRCQEPFPAAHPSKRFLTPFSFQIQVDAEAVGSL